MRAMRDRITFESSTMSSFIRIIFIRSFAAKAQRTQRIFWFFYSYFSLRPLCCAGRANVAGAWMRWSDRLCGKNYLNPLHRKPNAELREHVLARGDAQARAQLLDLLLDDVHADAV